MLIYSIREKQYEFEGFAATWQFWWAPGCFLASCSKICRPFIVIPEDQIIDCLLKGIDELLVDLESLCWLFGPSLE
jgi:hypothetical protein